MDETARSRVDKLTIVRGVPNEAEAIYGLLEECGRHMVTQGFSNWDPPPFTVRRVRNDLETRTVLTARDTAGRIVGTITVGTEPQKYFEEPLRAGQIRWANPSALAVYINRLGVHPSWQGTGLGARLLAEAETWARTIEASALRLEAFAANEGLLRWYERRGYGECGFRSAPDRDLRALEKVLAGA